MKKLHRSALAMLLCATLVAGTIPGGAFAAAAAQEDSILAPEPIGYANVLDMTGVPEPDTMGITAPISGPATWAPGMAIICIPKTPRTLTAALPAR
ncbi:MAG: hypothetical protein ACLVDB_09890 [Anaeromassilibacillus sp.]